MAGSFKKTLRHIFQLYPAFHYSKIFGEISYYSGTYFHVQEGRWIKGAGLKYENLFAKNDGKLLLVSRQAAYHAPTTFESYL